MPELSDVLKKDLYNLDINEVDDEFNEIPKKRKISKKIKIITEDKYPRPALELLTKDFEKYITTLTIKNNPVVKLSFKCGKTIYGIKNQNKKKDFRILAFKSKKTGVVGKSRCVYFFGLIKEKVDLPGIKIIKKNSGTVQSKKSVQLIVDRITFTKYFDQNTNKVLNILKKLANLTIKQKTKLFENKKDSK